MLRSALLGCIANLLAMLTFILSVYVALAVFALIFTASHQSAVVADDAAIVQSLPARLGESLRASAVNAATDIWALRGVLALFGAWGVLTAWVYQMGLHIAPRQAWTLSFLALAAILTVASVTWAFIQREQIALWMVEAPEVYHWRDLMLDSQRAGVTVAPLFALTVAYPVWAVWRWWYVKLDAIRPSPQAEQDVPNQRRDTALPQHRAYAARLHELKTGEIAHRDLSAGNLASLATVGGASRQQREFRLLMGLALAAIGFGLLYVVAADYHERVALRLQHGTAFLNAATNPQAEFTLLLAADVGRLRMVNVNGEGVMRYYVTRAEDSSQPVIDASEWPFRRRGDEYLYQEVPINGLAAGEYTLHLVQEFGWGYFEFVMSHGGGRASHQWATVAGFALACGLLALMGLAALLIYHIQRRFAAAGG